MACPGVGHCLVISHTKGQKVRFYWAKPGLFWTEPALKARGGRMDSGQSGLASCLLIGLVLIKTPGATSQRSLARLKDSSEV